LRPAAPVATDAAFWRRILYGFNVPGNPPPRDAHIAEAVADVVRYGAAIDRLDAAGGRRERERMRLVRAHGDAMRRWAEAIPDRGKTDARLWALTATARALLALPRDDDAVVRLVGPWVASIITEAVATATMQAAGAGRANQRRTEADRHRAEYAEIQKKNPAASKAWAADVIANECVKAGRRCCPTTVHGHLKGRASGH
jgi:hypothetical protein